jgi:hypothetical protein
LQPLYHPAGVVEATVEEEVHGGALGRRRNCERPAAVKLGRRQLGFPGLGVDEGDPKKQIERERG